MSKKIKRSGSFYVYILECSDGTFYTGYTKNIEARIGLHSSGKGAKYTRDRRPVKLAWVKEYKYFKRAFMRELEIKRMSRKKKEELVRSCLKINIG
ncbi:MAG: GIY-YIG nuclease family protein [Candidatus Kaelpia aquatica]|nr:GIY-YIG nuclease family protein [Candidatus Kaelpia aquatica]